jgi:two-component system osmolarity sensor histidine kinase EnvZ
MAAPPVKQFLPHSLFGRAVAILIVPILLLQLVVGLVFFQRYYQRVTEQLTGMTAREIRFAVEEAEAAGGAEAATRRLAELAGPLGFGLTLRPDMRVSPGVEREGLDLTGTVVVETLQEAIRRPMWIDLASSSRTAVIAIDIAPGVLEAVVPRSRLAASNPHQLLVYMIVAAVLFSAVAVAFLRNQIRPIRQLAEASDAFGKGRNLPFRPGGA